MKSSVWVKELVVRLVSESRTVSEVLRGLGLTASSGNYRTFYAYRDRWNLDISHFKGSLVGLEGLPVKVPLEKILVRNSSYRSMSGLKRRLISEGLLEYRCSECGLDSWRNQPLSLQLDHINGDHRDHRLSNLRLLCPNCHSQTDTYAGRSKKFRRRFCLDCGRPVKTTKAIRCSSCNVRLISSPVRIPKIDWPSKETLSALVWARPLTALSKDLGVSDSAIRKRCRKLDISLPRQGYWQRGRPPGVA